MPKKVAQRVPNSSMESTELGLVTRFDLNSLFFYDPPPHLERGRSTRAEEKFEIEMRLLA